MISNGDSPALVHVTSEYGNLHNRFEEAAELISASWKENKDQALDYNAEFLHSCYEYPGVDPNLSPVIFLEDRLAAFVCAFPRNAMLHGKPVRLAMLTFFTVASGMKGKGLGLAVWAECLRRVRAAGFDGALHYCVDGNRSNAVTVAAAESIGLQSHRIFTVKYLMRVITSSADAAPRQVADERFRSAFESLAGTLPRDLNLSRVWTNAEVEWECNDRYGAVVACRDHQPEDGLLTGYVLEMTDRERTPCLFIENLFWTGLDESGRSSLLQSLLNQAAERARVAVVPLWNYADTSVFARAGFRQSTRMLHMYVTLWNGAEPPSPPMYMDVF